MQFGWEEQEESEGRWESVGVEELEEQEEVEEMVEEGVEEKEPAGSA